jgi:hypothetical protein
MTSCIFYLSNNEAQIQGKVLQHSQPLGRTLQNGTKILSLAHSLFPGNLSLSTAGLPVSSVCVCVRMCVRVYVVCVRVNVFVCVCVCRVCLCCVCVSICVFVCFCVQLCLTAIHNTDKFLLMLKSK